MSHGADLAALGDARLTITRTWDDQPSGAEVHLSLRWTPDALRVEVRAPWRGDPAPPGPPGPTPRLWEHEVVELFLLGDGARYLEVELGPHGHHLVLTLHGERRVVREALPLDYQVCRQGPDWRGVASLRRAWLPAGLARLNAYAIHGRAEARRHLAWRPTMGERPDFHRLDRFGPWPTTAPD